MRAAFQSLHESLLPRRFQLTGHSQAPETTPLLDDPRSINTSLEEALLDRVHGPALHVPAPTIQWGRSNVSAHDVAAEPALTSEAAAMPSPANTELGALEIDGAASERDIEGGAPAVPAHRRRAYFPAAKNALVKTFVGALLLASGAIGHASWNALRAPRARVAPAAEPAFYNVEPHLQPLFSQAMHSARRSALFRQLETDIAEQGGLINVDHQTGSKADTTAPVGPNEIRIKWDPFGGLIYKNFEDNSSSHAGKSNSATMMFIHEELHAKKMLENPLASYVNMLLKLPFNTTVEEFRVIGLANAIARELGEAERDNHIGMYEKMGSVDERPSGELSDEQCLQIAATALSFYNGGEPSRTAMHALENAALHIFGSALEALPAEKAAAIRHLFRENSVLNQQLVTSISGDGANATASNVTADDITRKLIRHAENALRVTEKLPHYDEDAWYNISSPWPTQTIFT